MFYSNVYVLVKTAFFNITFEYNLLGLRTEQYRRNLGYFGGPCYSHHTPLSCASLILSIHSFTVKTEAEVSINLSVIFHETEHPPHKTLFIINTTMRNSDPTDV